MSARPDVGGWRLLLALALWLGLGAAAAGTTIVALRLAARGWAGTHGPDLAAIFIGEAYLALLLALLIAFGGPSGIRDRLRFRFTSVLDLALALVVWLAALLLGGVVSAALVPLLGEPQSNTAPLLGMSFDPLFVGIVVPTVCLLAPACEELLFRGALFGWLRRRLPAVLTVLLSAALFAAAHLLPTLFPILFVFGLGAGWIRERTDSTFNSFAMHAIQNTFAVSVTYLLLTRGV